MWNLGPRLRGDDVFGARGVVSGNAWHGVFALDYWKVYRAPKVNKRPRAPSKSSGLYDWAP